jgi:hypothetical protein
MSADDLASGVGIGMSAACALALLWWIGYKLWMKYVEGPRWARMARESFISNYKQGLAMLVKQRDAKNPGESS